MSILPRLFFGLSKARGSSGRPTVAVDSKAFTTGAEEIIMLLPGIAFTPPAGWSPFTALKTPQSPENVRIANPSLLGRGGMTTCLLFPAGLPLSLCVERLTGSPTTTMRLVEKMNRVSGIGLSILFLHLIGKAKGYPGDAHTMHCFFTNSAGQTVDLYCVGSSEKDARATTDAFVRTLRLTSSPSDVALPQAASSECRV